MAVTHAPADRRWMARALEEASAAAEVGDVPVGAVIVDAQGQLVATGRNQREAAGDPTAHAEVEALRSAARRRGGWHLGGLTLYVTLEPCAMCAGALVNSRIDRLVYGAPNLEAGAIDTLFVLGRDPRLNHRFTVTRGVMADEAAALLRRFFAGRRGGMSVTSPDAGDSKG
jgi:tRNA(adenine34) deaminase